MMSKLLALAFVGVAAATNHSGNGTHTTGSSSGAGANGGGAVTVAAGTNEAVAALFSNFTKDDSLTGTQASMYYKATVELTLPANVTASDITGVTLSSTGACAITTQTVPVAAICAVETSLDAAAKTVDTGATAKVEDVTTSRRRSLTETSQRRLATANLKFTTKIVGTSAAAVNGIAAAAKTAAFQTAFTDKMATIDGYSATVALAQDTDFSKVCQASGCAAAVPAAYTAPSTTSSGSSSDAFKTGLGLAAAVVSGLFLF